MTTEERGRLPLRVAASNPPWAILALAAIVGLYISRIIAESVPQGWSWRYLAPLIAASLTISSLILYGARHSLKQRWPVWLLAIYVCWPWAAPNVGWGIGGVALCALLSLSLPQRAWRFWPEVGVFLAALAVYMYTLAPCVLPADSGELQLVSYELGMAHPPGYPLYTLLGKLFTLLPVGDIAYRVNLLGAVCGALGLAIVVRGVRLAGGSTLAALVAAVMLGASPTYWAQSTVANIRSLTALFTALTLTLALRWGQTRSARHLAALAFCFGLGVGHHLSTAWIGPPLAAYVLVCDAPLVRQPKRWIGPAAALASSFLVLLYLPLISLFGAAPSIQPIRSLGDLGRYALALDFRGDMFYFRTLSELSARLQIWLNIMRLQFGAALCLAALLAIIPAFHKSWRVTLLLLGAWALNTLTALTYRAPQTVEYLIPSYVAIALLLGYGLSAIRENTPGNAQNSVTLGGVKGLPHERRGFLVDAKKPASSIWRAQARTTNRIAAVQNTRLVVSALALSPSEQASSGSNAKAWHGHAQDDAVAHGGALAYAARRAASTLLAALLLTAACWNGAANLGSFRALSADRSTREYAENLLRAAPAHSLILANWHHATPLWYLQRVEGLRPDIEVVYVYPEGATPNEQVWLRRVGEQLAQRPVLVTNYFYAFEHAPYRWIPVQGAWLVREQPLESAPAGITPRPAAFGENIQLLGFEMGDATIQPGKTLDLRVYWQAQGALEHDYSTFVQIVGPQGVVGQADIAHRSRAFAPGEVRVDAYHIPLLFHTPPGDYQLITGFYYTTEGGWQRLSTDGSDHLALTTISVAAAQQSPATLHPMQQSWANGLQLAGYDVDASLPGQTRLYLHWRRASSFLPQKGDATTLGATLLIHQEGQVLAQASIPALPAGAAATIALDMPSSLSRVTLGLVDLEGAPVARLGPWHRLLRGDLPLRLPREPALYIPLDAGLALVGLEQRVAAGQSVWLKPIFLCMAPLTDDYTVSVGIKEIASGREVKSDGTPALGAIPTLKWIGGWLVEDPHLVESLGIRGETRITLSLYDAFTLQPVRVLDERRVRQGQGTFLELDTPTSR